jgi:hypothetical protein
VWCKDLLSELGGGRVGDLGERALQTKGLKKE